MNKINKALASELPIDAILPEAARLLADEPRLIIEAAPGAGKTTRVPLALLGLPALAGQTIIMLEPRRLAARSAARHMARLVGEEPGRAIGWQTALDGCRSRETRVLVVTEGILTRMLQADPELSGVGCLIFDEFHERSLQADLGLALALDCQESLRPDLRLIIMSATLDGAALSAMMEGCPRLEAPGRMFPVKTRYLPLSRFGMSLEEHMCAAILHLVEEERGDILAFLPGGAEIRRLASRLSAYALPVGTAVLPLYGDLPPAEQDRVVAPSRSGERKIVLATNIAESSLTIEGVRIVVDSGLARRQRFDPGLGMSALVTERISMASARQRTGRAGRLEPGLCLRLWPEHENAALREQIRPEIMDSDLTPLALELAAWGLPVTDAPPDQLHWLDLPPAEAWREGREVLDSLGALDKAGRITAYGRKMADLPMHPRLAHMAISGRERGQGFTACLLASVFSERDPLGNARAGVGADIGARLAMLARDDVRVTTNGRSRRNSGGEGAFSGFDEPGRSSKGGLTVRLREQARRFAARLGVKATDERGESANIGSLVALAWPERVAMRRAPGSYIMAAGRGAALYHDDPLGASPFLAIAALDAGSADARIHLAAPLDPIDIELLFADRITEETSVSWDEGRQAVLARSRRKLGALILAEAPLAEPPADLILRALLDALYKNGLQRLPWTNELEGWRQRVNFVRKALDAGAAAVGGNAEIWPDMSDAALLAGLDDWLGPHLAGADRLGRISSELLGRALQMLLPWPLPRLLDELAPERLAVPSGSLITLDYSAAGARDGANIDGPVLAVKLQELFGLERTPTVAGGRVPVIIHLLSPAGRPVQITRDLAGFWRVGYAAVRAELRGRYPKHPWPEDPLKAIPTRKTNKRLALESEKKIIF